MKLSEDLLHRRDLLEERFRSEVSWREGTADRIPDWFGALLTDLVLAIGDEDIVYLSAHYVPTGDASLGSMAVVLFSDELVAYAALDPDPMLGPTQFEVVVTARRALNNFSVETEPGADAAEADLDNLRISVSYPQFSRTLPLGRSDWPGRGTETTELLRCLRRDLVA